MSLTFRVARREDHPSFSRLFLELGVDDPVPVEARFATELAPEMLVAEGEGAVVAYVHFQALDGEGYVRQVVVAPEVRRRGVGAAILQEVGQRLRAAGARRWCLNVKADNLPAIRLYARFGMAPAYRSAAVRFPWALVDALPTALREPIPLRVEAEAPLAASSDGSFERRFDLPAGLLAARRARGFALAGLREGTTPVGAAAFNPRHPGAFPFRVARPGLAGPLLDLLRPHALSDRPEMQIVAEDDAALVAALLAAGAALVLETVHYRGPL